MSSDGRHEHADPEQAMPYDRAEWEARLDAARARRAEALARRSTSGRPPVRQDLGTRLARARADAASRAPAPMQPPLRLGPEVRLPPAHETPRPRARRRLTWSAVALAGLGGAAALTLGPETPLHAWLDALAGRTDTGAAAPTPPADISALPSHGRAEDG